MSRASRQPKIIVLGQFPPSSGGICTNIQNLMNSPLKDKYCFFPFQTGSKKYGNLGYFEEKVFSKFFRTVKSFFSYIAFLVKNHPTLVHINTSLASFSFWRDVSFLVITKLFGASVLFQIHGGVLIDFLENKYFVTSLLVKRLLAIPDQIVVLSFAQKKSFELLGISQKMKVVPNMINIDRFNENGNQRQYLNVPAEYTVILFVAPIFFERKGVWEILEAIPIVIKNHMRTLFVFVGGDKEENAMKRHCIKEGLQDHVFFAGHLFGKDILKIYRESDIFILPTYSEGFPLVILEAMAAGLPIVSTPVGAIPEIIEDGVNGFLVPPKNSKMLAERIILLIKDKHLREKMATNNKRKVKEKYDMRPVSRIFDEIYQEMIY